MGEDWRHSVTHSLLKKKRKKRKNTNFMRNKHTEIEYKKVLTKIKKFSSRTQMSPFLSKKGKARSRIS